MSVSKINFNDNQEAYILVEPISEIDRTDFKTYLDLDSPSFLPCEFENDKAFTLYYHYGNRITLKQFLSRVVNRADVTGFLKSLTKVYMDAENNHLKTEHILLGINSIFYNEETQQVSCVYVPVVDGVLPVRPLRLFLKEMLVNMVYSEDEDMAWLGNIIRYISRNRNLSYDDFYEFLQTQEEGAGEPETNEKAGWETKIVDGISQTSGIPAEAPETEAASGTEPEVKSRGLENHEEEDELEDLKSVLESIPAAESVSVLKADTSEMELSSVVEEVSETEMEREDKTEAEQEAKASEETDEFLENIQSPSVEGMLVRCSKHEAYPLNQEKIRIGKSAEVEIHISDNPAVSRIHAIILCLGDTFRIRDNESTNHTFVNGILLKDNQEKILTPGDRILLGNEEFVFKIR